MPPPGPAPAVSDTPPEPTDAGQAMTRPDEQPEGAGGTAYEAADYAPQPPPGWVGKWRPPVPTEPTEDPSTWPALGVAPGAGANVGAWAINEPAPPVAPEDRR